MKVRNMLSGHGNSVANQFEIESVSGTYFQSYSSIIAFIDNSGQVFLDERYWNYSVTTGKYRNQFLGECLAETRKKINDGTYKLTNLNK